ncbi:diguanylate cyclase [Sphingomonas sp.]|uniref:sensor domain-containing diguanylate cyclase n=1 Tax=Sphingomonas sp. TaxID=28214 RepID=UPI001B1078CA|nr:diguanylate cyclase [Sphingomonas sp.]MBO9714676.1 diguanylate cyclase [Sphingomonas sp.]
MFRRAGLVRSLAAGFVLLAALWLVPAAPAHAQAGVAGQPLGVCLLRDRPGLTAAEVLRHPQWFDCNTSQYKLGAGDWWVLSSPVDRLSSASDPLAVRYATLWQRGATLNVVYADGHVAATHADRFQLNRLVQLGAQTEQPIPASHSRVARLLWHVEDSANMRGVMIGARVVTAQESARANLTMGAMYSAFAGLCIALLVFNLALWGAMRHRFQLYYCAMVASLLAYAFSSSGALSWALPHAPNTLRLRFNYLELSLAGAAALIFARSFFEERVFADWLGKLTVICASVMIGGGLVFFFAAPLAVRTVDLVFTLTFLGMATVVVPTLWRAWRTRSNYLWLFAIAWGLPILTAILRVFANLHIVDWSFWLDNSTLISMVAEALLSSFAIAYRIKLLGKERDEAILGEELARRLADLDPLTGLLNRRAFLEQAIGRDGAQVLQIADLDHFKSVNDTLGHDGGDEVLRLFARMLRNAVPAGTLVARIGGEEFAILSDAHSAVEPEIVLARLRATRMPFDLTVTASIGSCSGLLTNEREWKSLYRGADSALFEAKSQGRDRARCAAAA